MTLTGAAQRPTKTAIRRPASGVSIDPARLTEMMARRGLSRLELSGLTYQLAPGCGACEQCRAGNPALCLDKRGISRDAIAKWENGQRRPKARTLRQLCEALACEPEDLLPAGPTMPVTILGLRARTRDALLTGGLATIGQLTAISAAGLRGFGFSEAAVSEIQAALAKEGLTLHGDTIEEE